MNYIVATFKITCDEELFQTASDLLVASAGEAGFESFESTGDTVLGYVPKNIFDKEKLDMELADFPMPDVKITYETDEMEDKDWNETWEETGFQPIDIDGKCMIYDAKHTDRSTVGDSCGLNIYIEAKQAFGTGTHQTTHMIVSEILRRADYIKDGRFLDCGCGTGILGIVASKNGAKEVIGYDIDMWGVDNAIHNAKLNNVNNMNVLFGDVSVLNEISGMFDMVAANINRNTLLSDIPDIAGKMKNGSILFLSGFYVTDIDMLLKRASGFGLHEEMRRTEDDWACLVMRKD